VSLKISGEIEEIEKLVRLFVRKVDEDFDWIFPLKYRMEKVDSVKRIHKDPGEIQSENKQLRHFNSPRWDKVDIGKQS
jgi:hypothetical protein